LKKTHLLRDDPASKDEFGTHKRIAELIRDEILQSNEGRSIAVVGEWGSGKSTVVKLLETELTESNSENAHIFVYDAWSHQGDPLRRAFLDDLIQSLKAKELLTEEEVAKTTDQVWNRTETTTTTAEPVLRRHAKLFLLTVFLVPFGLGLFEIPSASGTSFWSALFATRNLVAIPLILAPVVMTVIFWAIKKLGPDRIKDRLFGPSYRDKEFSVLSFFVEKVQGKIERKRIKSPADSIGEFRDVFSHLVDTVHAQNPELRLVIVIDNIDRIPSAQARDFWSTMQTFFGESGGLRKPRIMKYWLIAPFSVEALSFVFHDNLPYGQVPAGPYGRDDKETPRISNDPVVKAKVYIDKTFGLAFFVPPPILANWRKYLLEQLSYAFPEHDESDRIAIQSLFDFVRSFSILTITPREIKLFVNGLVVLYWQRGDEIPLPVMATYFLHKDEIRGTEIRDNLLSDAERRVIANSEWPSLFASLHFGVRPC